MLTFQGSANFRLRLVLATLAGKPVRITGIWPDEASPGLRDYEITFLRLLESVTNGSVIEISYTGTSVIYKPGLIIGGSHTFNCPLSRSIGYYIEPLLLLAPFAKQASVVVLNGITAASELDIGVDAVRTVLFPALAKFGIDRSELRIVRRGSAPQGGGQAILRMPHQILQPKTLHAIEQISVRRIRGVAYSTRVSPATVNRCIENCRTVLKPTKVDTHIYSDAARGEEAGSSPGFGVTLVAETKHGWPVGAQSVAESAAVPEDIGAQAGERLLREISMRGALGRLELPLTVVLMALGPEDVGRLLLGERQVDAELVQLFKNIAEFWPGTHVAFKEPDEEGNMIMLLKGTGFVNANMKIA